MWDAKRSAQPFATGLFVRGNDGGMLRALLSVSRPRKVVGCGQCHTRPPPIWDSNWQLEI